MENTTKFKICVLIALLMYLNILVWFLYLSFSKATKTTKETIVRVKSRMSQEQKEKLVELTKENSHLTYIFNHE